MGKTPILEILKLDGAKIDKSILYPKQRAEFLMQDKNMRGKYLGACLDGVRWGSPTTVMYEMSVSGLIRFVQSWMRQNEENAEKFFMPEELDEFYTDVHLPHMDHKTCPANSEHKDTVTDLAGRVRCANKSIIKMKEGYIFPFEMFDKDSMARKTYFSENKPSSPHPDDYSDKDYLWEFRKFSRDMERYQNSKDVEIVDTCYSIISDRGVILPLETIIDRLNLAYKTITLYCKDEFSGCERLDDLKPADRTFYEQAGFCPGHSKEIEQVIFDFDGWELAALVKKWYSQEPKGIASLFNKE